MNERVTVDDLNVVRALMLKAPDDELASTGCAMALAWDRPPSATQILETHREAARDELALPTVSALLGLAYHTTLRLERSKR